MEAAAVVVAGAREGGGEGGATLAMNSLAIVLGESLFKPFSKAHQIRITGSAAEITALEAPSSIVKFSRSLEISSETLVTHTSMVERFVTNLGEHGILNIESAAAKEASVKIYQKKFLEYQKQLVNIGSEEHWIKIVGNPQITGTAGHAEAMAKFAIDAAKDSNTLLVCMNQGIKKATGILPHSNIRPDIIVVKVDGSVSFYEVMSKTDTKRDLIRRINSGMSQLPANMRGVTRVLEIEDILGM